MGFRFFRTKLFGSIAIPFHSDFEEVNLRFYVRRQEGDEHRRGVVFVAEIVPRRAVAALARLLYDENYVCLPMKNYIETDGSQKTIEYYWQVKDQWCQLTAPAHGIPEVPKEGSLEQFITEHHWGYSKQRGGGSLEYHVSHVPWQIWVRTTAGFKGDASGLSGGELGHFLQQPPSSAFIADGWPVTVFRGHKLP